MCPSSRSFTGTMQAHTTPYNDLLGHSEHTELTLWSFLWTIRDLMQNKSIRLWTLQLGSNKIDCREANTVINPGTLKIEINFTHYKRTLKMGTWRTLWWRIERTSNARGWRTVCSRIVWRRCGVGWETLLKTAGPCSWTDKEHSERVKNRFSVSD